MGKQVQRKKMTRDLLLMAISLFTWGIGEGMFYIFQPLYLQKWGANPVEIGAILGGMGIAMTVVQVPAGYLADRVGPRPVMWASWVLGTIAAGIMAMAGSLPVFVIGLFAYGLTSFVVAPMNHYISSVRGSWSVERALTVVSAMFQLGAVAGPLIGGLLGERYGLAVVYRISAVIFVASTIVVLFTHHAPEEEMSEHHAHQPSLLRNPRFFGLLVLIMLTMFALYLPQPLTPNYLQNVHGFSLKTIGQFGSIGSLGNALLMLGLGHLSAPAGFLIGQALVGLFALAMWRGDAAPVFFLGYFFIGGFRLARSMALAYTRSLVKINEIGLAFGLVESGNAASTIIAPVVAGFLYARNPQMIYVVTLAALSLMLLVNFAMLSGKSALIRPHVAPRDWKAEPEGDVEENAA
jgi:MFS family permease